MMSKEKDIGKPTEREKRVFWQGLKILIEDLAELYKTDPDGYHEVRRKHSTSPTKGSPSDSTSKPEQD